MKIAIIGAGELGKLLAHHAVQSCKYSVVGYYDDFNTEKSFNNLPILGKGDQLIADYNNQLFDAIVIAIGYYKMDARIRYYEQFKGKVPLANIVHHSCYVDPSCIIGEGVCLLPGCTIDFEAVLEDNVLLNTGVTVAHHSVIGKNSFLGPAVQIAGYVKIAPACFLGIGTTIIDCLTINERAIIGAGAVVTNDVPAATVSVGVPARVIKQTVLHG